jgi:HSP20 family protein
MPRSAVYSGHIGAARMALPPATMAKRTWRMNKQSRMPSLSGSFGGWPFSSLHREIDRVFDDFTRGMRPASGESPWNDALSPSVDVAETDKAVEISAELPGVDEADIDLTVSDDAITLKAEKKTDREEKDEKKNYHLVERSYGMFQRRIAMPFKIDPEKVDAKFDKGVLKVSVAKPEAEVARTRKIEVKAQG